jgi:Tfp pilus assembly protein PilE
MFGGRDAAQATLTVLAVLALIAARRPSSWRNAAARWRLQIQRALLARVATRVRRVFFCRARR